MPRRRYDEANLWQDYVLDALLGIPPNNNAPGRDPFGGTRVSQKFNLFNSKLLGDNRPLFWNDVEASGAGTNSTYDINASTVTLSVGNLTAGKRVRQTFQAMNYQPGNGQQILLTFVLGEKATGITRRVGYFNDNNGLFLEQTDTELAFVVRSSATGSVVDNRIVQADWSFDQLSELDDTKSQILWIDFESLQVGSVRYAAVIDGIIKYAHSENHANRLDRVYFATPNLPLRYEIENDGTGPAATMQVICNTVNSEGGQDVPGINRAISTEGVALSAPSADTLYALLGIRLKATHTDNVIKANAIKIITETNDDFEWQILLNPTIADTFTYSDLANSPVQGAKGVTANTVTGGTFLDGGWGKSGSATDSVADTLRYLGVAVDGTRDTIVLCVRPLSNAAQFQGTFTWKETS